MANNFAANPIKVDTVMGAGITTERQIPIRVVKISWENPTTLAHTFVITDASTAANVLFEGRCEVANQSQVFDFAIPITWKNFRLTTLGSGTLWIYHR